MAHVIKFGTTDGTGRHRNGPDSFVLFLYVDGSGLMRDWEDFWRDHILPTTSLVSCPSSPQPASSTVWPQPMSDLPFAPSPWNYAVAQMDPVSMVQHLDDSQALEAAERIQPKAYLVHLSWVSPHSLTASVCYAVDIADTWRSCRRIQSCPFPGSRGTVSRRH